MCQEGRVKGIKQRSEEEIKERYKGVKERCKEFKMIGERKVREEGKRKEGEVKRREKKKGMEWY